MIHSGAVVGAGLPQVSLSGISFLSIIYHASPQHYTLMQTLIALLFEVFVNPF